MIFYDSKKEFEFSILPIDGEKQMYMLLKMLVNFFMLKKYLKMLLVEH